MDKIATLRVKRLGIETYKEAIVYLHRNCHICRAEGFESHTRVSVTLGSHSIVATLNIINSDLLEDNEVGLSEYAWHLLSPKEAARVTLTHAQPVKSLSFVRSKIYGNDLSGSQIEQIISDISEGLYSDINIASFLTACSGGRMGINEITHLTKAMVDSGNILSWPSDIVVDKHCVGGLPGNRTTPIVVSIVASLGLIIPKTSSRAITSPAGTADTMEVLAPVNISIEKMKKIVEAENGCIVWGGSVALSPVDDMIIRIERALDLDSEGQLIASVLSKKIAVGSTHVLIDIPIGTTAKVRSQQMAQQLKRYLESVGAAFNLQVKVIFTDGTQPVGRGIGPALEARDVVDVLRGDATAPQDLRDRAVLIAGHILESSTKVAKGDGVNVATDILTSGRAWKKFQAICEAQGGMRDIPTARYTHPYSAVNAGTIDSIDNRRIALVAKLAGAPADKVAGVYLHKHIGMKVVKGEPLFTLHAHSPGALEYALNYLRENDDIIRVQG